MKGFIIIMVVVVALVVMGIVAGCMRDRRECVEIEGFDKDSPSYMIAMFLTEKHSQEAENAIISLERVGMKDNLVVTCLDKGSYEYMGKLGVKRRLVDADLAKEADFGTLEFYKIQMEKLKMIQHQTFWGNWYFT